MLPLLKYLLSTAYFIKKSNARQWYIVILQDLEDIFNSEYIIMQDQLQINKFGKNTIDAYK